MSATFKIDVVGQSPTARGAILSVPRDHLSFDAKGAIFQVLGPDKAPIGLAIASVAFGHSHSAYRHVHVQAAKAIPGETRCSLVATGIIDDGSAFRTHSTVDGDVMPYLRTATVGGKPLPWTSHTTVESTSLMRVVESMAIVPGYARHVQWTTLTSDSRIIGVESRTTRLETCALDAAIELADAPDADIVLEHSVQDYQDGRCTGVAAIVTMVAKSDDTIETDDGIVPDGISEQVSAIFARCDEQTWDGHLLSHRYARADSAWPVPGRALDNHWKSVGLSKRDTRAVGGDDYFGATAGLWFLFGDGATLFGAADEIVGECIRPNGHFGPDGKRIDLKAAGALNWQGMPHGTSSNYGSFGDKAGLKVVKDTVIPEGALHDRSITTAAVRQKAMRPYDAAHLNLDGLFVYMLATGSRLARDFLESSAELTLAGHANTFNSQRASGRTSQFAQDAAMVLDGEGETLWSERFADYYDAVWIPAMARRVNTVKQPATDTVYSPRYADKTYVSGVPHIATAVSSMMTGHELGGVACGLLSGFMPWGDEYLADIVKQAESGVESFFKWCDVKQEWLVRYFISASADLAKIVDYDPKGPKDAKGEEGLWTAKLAGSHRAMRLTCSSVLAIVATCSKNAALRKRAREIWHFDPVNFWDAASWRPFTLAELHSAITENAPKIVCAEAAGELGVEPKPNPKPVEPIDPVVTPKPVEPVGVTVEERIDAFHRLSAMVEEMASFMTSPGLVAEARKYLDAAIVPIKTAAAIQAKSAK